ncbi:hypothetical protein MMC25_006360 [Agyrium rufum]|nr:hypothetical protein [Agyrium rufum]
MAEKFWHELKQYAGTISPGPSMIFGVTTPGSSQATLPELATRTTTVRKTLANKKRKVMVELSTNTTASTPRITVTPKTIPAKKAPQTVTLSQSTEPIDIDMADQETAPS